MLKIMERLMKHKSSLFSISKVSMNHEAMSQIFVLHLNIVLFVLYVFIKGVL